MAQTAKVAPRNSLLFISDQNGGDPLDFDSDATILFNTTVVSVVCRMWQDGETEITLGTAAEVDPGWPDAFEGHLEIKGGVIVVSTVDHAPILTENVSANRVRVRIWINSEREPDRVIVGIDS